MTVLLTITSSKALSSPPPLASLNADSSLGRGAEISLEASDSVNLTFFCERGCVGVVGFRGKTRDADKTAGKIQTGWSGQQKTSYAQDLSQVRATASNRVDGIPIIQRPFHSILFYRRLIRIASHISWTTTNTPSILYQSGRQRDMLHVFKAICSEAWPLQLHVANQKATGTKPNRREAVLPPS